MSYSRRTRLAILYVTVPGVVGCHAVRTRGAESSVCVDLHVQVEPQTTVERGHAIAHDVETALRRRYGQITDIVVHIEPPDAGPGAGTPPPGATT